MSLQLMKKFGNDVQNGDNVLINAEDIEFGTQDGSSNGITTIDQGWFGKNSFIVLNSIMLNIFSL